MNINMRFLDNVAHRRRGEPFKKTVCLITAVAFLFNTVYADLSLAITTTPEYASPAAKAAKTIPPVKELRVDTFTLPEYLGSIKDKHRSDTQPERIMVHIQDAHANYSCQKRIAEIIKYLNKEYNASVINLEGGSRDYDLSIFTRIPDLNVREKVADSFVSEGLLNGAEFFGVLNPDKVTLWGIEDPALYMENLNIYRDSLRDKEEVERHLKALNHILSNLKARIYTKELLDFDMSYCAYKAGNLDFRSYLAFLIERARQHAIPLASFPNLFLIQQSLDMESSINFKKASNERDALVDKLSKTLSKNAMEELVLKTVEFKAERLSRENFYSYLIKKAKSINLSVNDYPELQKYIAYVSSYGAADRSKLAREIASLEERIKELLYANDDQRRLAGLSKNLALLKNIFDISLTKEDYRYYQQNEASFDMANYVSFIRSKTPLYKITATLDADIGKVDTYRTDITKFYDCSLKRDEAFLNNIVFGGGLAPDGSRILQVAVIVTGGFHTENLCELFKKKGISYISIMPNFKMPEKYECPYFKLLAGEVTGIQKRLYSVIAAMPAAAMIQIASMLSDAIAPEVWGRANVTAFRAAVWIQAQMAQGKKVVIVDDGGTVLKDSAGAELVFGEGTEMRIAANLLADMVQKEAAGEENGAAIRLSGGNLNGAEHLVLNKAIAETLNTDEARKRCRVGTFEGMTLYAIPGLKELYKKKLKEYGYLEGEATEIAADIVAHAGHRLGNIYMDADVYNKLKDVSGALDNIARHERGHMIEYMRRMRKKGYANRGEVKDDRVSAGFYAKEEELAKDSAAEQAKQAVIALFRPGAAPAAPIPPAAPRAPPAPTAPAIPAAAVATAPRIAAAPAARRPAAELKPVAGEAPEQQVARLSKELAAKRAELAAARVSTSDMFFRYCGLLRALLDRGYWQIDFKLNNAMFTGDTPLAKAFDYDMLFDITDIRWDDVRYFIYSAILQTADSAFYEKSLDVKSQYQEEWFLDYLNSYLDTLAALGIGAEVFGRRDSDQRARAIALVNKYIQMRKTPGATVSVGDILDTDVEDFLAGTFPDESQALMRQRVIASIVGLAGMAAAKARKRAAVDTNVLRQADVNEGLSQLLRYGVGKYDQGGFNGIYDRRQFSDDMTAIADTFREPGIDDEDKVSPEDFLEKLVAKLREMPTEKRTIAIGNAIKLVLKEKEDKAPLEGSSRSAAEFQELYAGAILLKDRKSIDALSAMTAFIQNYLENAALTGQVDQLMPADNVFKKPWRKRKDEAAYVEFSGPEKGLTRDLSGLVFSVYPETDKLKGLYADDEVDKAAFSKLIQRHKGRFAQVINLDKPIIIGNERVYVVEFQDGERLGIADKVFEKLMRDVSGSRRQAELMGRASRDMEGLIVPVTYFESGGMIIGFAQPVFKESQEAGAYFDAAADKENAIRAEIDVLNERITAIETKLAEGELSKEAQEQINILSRGDDLTGENRPNVFQLLGNPDLRTFIEFAKIWDKDHYGTPILCVGGYGRGTRELIAQTLDYYGNKADLTPAEEAWLKEALEAIDAAHNGRGVLPLGPERTALAARLNAIKLRETAISIEGATETHILNFILQKEGIDRKYINLETAASRNTEENFRLNSDLIRKLAGNRDNPVIGIVTSPYKLLRARIVAESEWGALDAARDFRAVRVKTYDMDLNSMPVPEFFSTLIYVAGAPDKYRAQHDALIEGSEISRAQKALSGNQLLPDDAVTEERYGVSWKGLNARDDRIRSSLELVLDRQVGGGKIHYDAAANGFLPPATAKALPLEPVTAATVAPRAPPRAGFAHMGTLFAVAGVAGIGILAIGWWQAVVPYLVAGLPYVAAIGVAALLGYLGYRLYATFAKPAVPAAAPRAPPLPLPEEAPTPPVVLEVVAGRIEEVVAHNLAMIRSPEFARIIGKESGGGNAGVNRIAVNVAVDPADGRIVAIGTKGDLPDEINNRIRDGSLVQVAFNLFLSDTLNPDAMDFWNSVMPFEYLSPEAQKNLVYTILKHNAANAAQLPEAKVRAGDVVVDIMSGELFMVRSVSADGKVRALKRGADGAEGTVSADAAGISKAAREGRYVIARSLTRPDVEVSVRKALRKPVQLDKAKSFFEIYNIMNSKWGEMPDERLLTMLTQAKIAQRAAAQRLRGEAATIPANLVSMGNGTPLEGLRTEVARVFDNVVSPKAPAPAAPAFTVPLPTAARVPATIAEAGSFDEVYAFINAKRAELRASGLSDQNISMIVAIVRGVQMLADERAQGKDVSINLRTVTNGAGTPIAGLRGKVAELVAKVPAAREAPPAVPTLATKATRELVEGFFSRHLTWMPSFMVELFVRIASVRETGAILLALFSRERIRDFIEKEHERVADPALAERQIAQRYFGFGLIWAATIGTFLLYFVGHVDPSIPQLVAALIYGGIYAVMANIAAHLGWDILVSPVLGVAALVTGKPALAELPRNREDAIAFVIRTFKENNNSFVSLSESQKEELAKAAGLGRWSALLAEAYKELNAQWLKNPGDPALLATFLAMTSEVGKAGMAAPAPAVPAAPVAPKIIPPAAPARLAPMVGVPAGTAAGRLLAMATQEIEAMAASDAKGARRLIDEAVREFEAAGRVTDEATGEIVGAGAFSTVYATGDPARVAKILKLKTGDRKAELFGKLIMLREAAVMAKLGGTEGVPRLYGVGLMADPEGGTQLGIVMERGDAMLNNVMTGQVTLTADETERLAVRLASVLAEIHKKGIWHLDVKPANIAIPLKRGPDGRPIRVAGAYVPDLDNAFFVDFGFAIDVSGEEKQKLLKDTGGVLRLPPENVYGTPDYLPAEAAGNEVSEKTDVYALGAVLYEAFTGRLYITDAVPRQIMEAKLRLAAAEARNKPADNKIEMARATARLMEKGLSLNLAEAITGSMREYQKDRVRSPQEFLAMLTRAPPAIAKVQPAPVAPAPAVEEYWFVTDRVYRSMLTDSIKQILEYARKQKIKTIVAPGRSAQPAALFLLMCWQRAYPDEPAPEIIYLDTPKSRGFDMDKVAAEIREKLAQRGAAAEVMLEQPILILDDVVSSGRTLENTRTVFRDKMKASSVYTSALFATGEVAVTGEPDEGGPPKRPDLYPTDRREFDSTNSWYVVRHWILGDRVQKSVADRLRQKYEMTMEQERKIFEEYLPHDLAMLASDVAASLGAKPAPVMATAAPRAPPAPPVIPVHPATLEQGNVLIISHAGSTEMGTGHGDTSGALRGAMAKLIPAFGANVQEFDASDYPSDLEHPGSVYVQKSPETDQYEYLKKTYEEKLKKRRGARYETATKLQERPDDYSIADLRGSDFVLTGGGYDYCHLEAFKELVGQVVAGFAQGRAKVPFVTITIPFDAVYVNYPAYNEEDELELRSKLLSSGLPRGEPLNFASYKEALDKSGISYSVIKVDENGRETVEKKGEEPKIVLRIEARVDNVLARLAPPAPPIAPVTGPAAKELAAAQVDLAKGVIGDLLRGTADFVIMPGSDVYKPQQTTVMRNTMRKLQKDYGQETLPYSYKYGPDWAKSLKEEVLPGAMGELRNRMEKGDKKARVVIYVPFAGVNAIKEFIASEYPGLEGRVSVVGETDIPANGVIDSVMHIVLGKGLLNYERYLKGDYGAEERLPEDAMLRLAEFMKILVANPEAIDFGKDPDIINKILNGAFPLRIKAIDFTDIIKWKSMQDEVLRAL